MKTLVEFSPSSATYDFTHDIGSRRVVINACQDENGDYMDTDFDAIAEAQHALWLEWLGVAP
jgi:hypothetical protein